MGWRVPASTCLESGGRSYGSWGSSPIRVIDPSKPFARSPCAVRNPASEAPTIVTRFGPAMAGLREHDDAAERGAGLDVAVGLGGVGEGERAVDDGAELAARRCVR